MTDIFTKRWDAANTDLLDWNEPQRILVDGDLFARPDKDIDRALAIIALCPQNRFFVLGEPGKMAEYFDSSVDGFSSPRRVGASILSECCEAQVRNPKSRVGNNTRCNADMSPKLWPLPNLTIGVRVTTQAEANERVPLLLRCPASSRWVDVEPREMIDLLYWQDAWRWMGPMPTDTWGRFAWPEWVPSDLRGHIESFWGVEIYGRSPKQWADSFIAKPTTTHNGMPSFGSRIGIDEKHCVCLASDPAAVKFGRIVPCWNNVAAIVFDDGAFRMGLGTSRGPGWLSCWLDDDGEYRHRIHLLTAHGGAESCRLGWIRSLRDQAAAAGVPFVFAGSLDDREWLELTK